MNQLQLQHYFITEPDKITVRLNDAIIYSGDACDKPIEFVPVQGTNLLTVTLDKKSLGNFYYNTQTSSVEKNSQVMIRELIVESRYFRSLLTKCGLVEIDLKKNPSFPSKYIDHENTLTMEGSVYSIKFDYPIKNWMQIHLHGRDLETLELTNQLVKERLKL